jgi:hypothetical protein
MIQSVKEKRFQLLQRPLAVLKTTIVSFSPKTLQEAQGRYLLNNSTLSAAVNPTSQQINYLSRHNPRQPESFEEGIPNSTSKLTSKKVISQANSHSKYKTSPSP